MMMILNEIVKDTGRVKGVLLALEALILSDDADDIDMHRQEQLSDFLYDAKSFIASTAEEGDSLRENVAKEVIHSLQQAPAFADGYETLWEEFCYEYNNGSILFETWEETVDEITKKEIGKLPLKQKIMISLSTEYTKDKFEGWSMSPDDAPFDIEGLLMELSDASIDDIRSAVILASYP